MQNTPEMEETLSKVPQVESVSALPVVTEASSEPPALLEDVEPTVNATETESEAATEAVTEDSSAATADNTEEAISAHNPESATQHIPSSTHNSETEQVHSSVPVKTNQDIIPSVQTVFQPESVQQTQEAQTSIVPAPPALIPITSPTAVAAPATLVHQTTTATTVPPTTTSNGAAGLPCPVQPPKTDILLQTAREVLQLPEHPSDIITGMQP